MTFACIAILSLLSGCVGEVQNAARETTISTGKDNPTNLDFQGLFDAIPIADDKIEVYFYPATGGSLRYSYQIYVGNQPEPVNVSEEVMDKDYRGMFRYTVTGLDIGTEYSIKVDVKDIETGAVKSTSNSAAVYTFSNYVADFSGISALGNAQGVQGVDSINVRWAHAAVPGGIFNNGDRPDSYEIIIIDSSKLTPSAIDDESLTPLDGRIVKTIQYDPLVTETVVRGLKQDTTFYVAVRCIHTGSVDDPSAPNLRGEKNHRYMEIKTLTRSAADIEYDPSEYVLSNNSGSLATNSFIAVWGDFVGVFDHFRLYYAKKPNLTLDTSLCAQGGGDDILGGSTFCKKMPVDGTSTVVADLPPQTEYQAQLLACLDAYCEDYVALPIKTITTATSLASFTGIEEIELAQSVSEIGSVKLTYPALNFETGYFDGLAIEFTTNKADLLAFLNGTGAKPTTYLVEESTSADHDLRHLYFDYAVDTSVIVTGLDYTAEQNYCFALYPYNLDPAQPDGKKYYSDNAVWKCKKVETLAPMGDEFEGASSAYTIRNEIVVNWGEPTGGVYSHFEVFLKPTSSGTNTAFSFDDAVSETTVYFDYSNYQRWLLSADNGVDGSGNALVLGTHSLQGLPDGYYIVGVLTYYNGGVLKIKRSENNNGLFMCQINSGLSIVDCQEI